MRWPARVRRSFRAWFRASYLEHEVDAELRSAFEERRDRRIGRRADELLRLLDK